MRNKKNKPEVTKYSIGVVTILLVACVCFIFLIFQTNVLMDIPIDKKGRLYDFERTSVVTIIREADDAEGGPGAPGGVIPGLPPPQTGHIMPVTEVAKKVYQCLKSLGYDDEACAGIMGNMELESGMQPGTTQSNTHDYASTTHCNANCRTGHGNAHGLVQWDYGRKEALFDLAISKSVEWHDLDLQLEYFTSEINGPERSSSPSRFWTGYNSEDRVEWATFKFANTFERCAGASAANTFNDRANIGHWTSRIQFARNYYTTIKSGAFN